MRHQNPGGRLRLVGFCRKPHDDFVDQRGGVFVLCLRICVRHEHPKPPLVKSRHGENLHIPCARFERVHLRGCVDGQVVHPLGENPQGVERFRVVVVLRPEKKRHFFAFPAERPDEVGHRRVYVIQCRVCPYPAAVEKVPGDDCHLRLLDRRRLRYRPHAFQRVLAPCVLPILDGTVQIPQVKVGAV